MQIVPCPQGNLRYWPWIIIPRMFTYNLLTFFSHVRQKSLECQPGNNSFRMAIGSKALSTHFTNGHGVGLEFNVALAILLLWLRLKGQSTVNKHKGTGLQNGSLHWDVCPGFTSGRKSFRETLPPDQLPVFRFGSIWMLTMFWDICFIATS